MRQIQDTGVGHHQSHRLPPNLSRVGWAGTRLLRQTLRPRGRRGRRDRNRELLTPAVSAHLRNGLASMSLSHFGC